MLETATVYALALVGFVWTPEPLGKGEFIDPSGRRRTPFGH